MKHISHFLLGNLQGNKGTVLNMDIATASQQQPKFGGNILLSSALELYVGALYSYRGMDSKSLVLIILETTLTFDFAIVKVPKSELKSILLRATSFQGTLNSYLGMEYESF